MGARPWDRGLSRKHILDAIDASLRRLRTDYVDLYQLHHPDRETPIDETLRALDDVVRAGKARYVGCSNYLAYQVARAIGRSEARGLVRFDSVQPRYNLLFRQIERELLPLCREEGIGVIPYNPLAGGFLTGKHRREAGPTAGTRFTLGNAAGRYQDRYWHEREFDTVEALRPLAAEAGISLTRMAVAWVLAHPAITAPIIGASRPEQLDDVLPAVEKDLGADIKARLDDAHRRLPAGRRSPLSGRRLLAWRAWRSSTTIRAWPLGLAEWKSLPGGPTSRPSPDHLDSRGRARASGWPTSTW